MASQQGSAAPTAAALGTENAPNGSHITFVIPPPVTFFMQLNDGVQVTFTPQPTPLVMGLPGLENVAVMVPGLLNQLLGGTGANGAQDEGGMMRVLHELFMQAQQQSHGPPPTSRSFLDKLPIKVWSDQVKACERQDECPICLSDFESNDQVISLPCGHLYHKECGLQWLVEHNVCPTCRYKLPTQQEEASTPATSATPEPPAAPQPSTSSNTQSTEQSPRVSRTRPRSPVISPVRVVRRRVGEVNEPTPEPTSETSSSSSIDDATLEIMLEEEAERFVAEERQTEQTSVMDVDSAMDQGVESLLQNNCNDTTK